MVWRKSGATCARKALLSRVEFNEVKGFGMLLVDMRKDGEKKIEVEGDVVAIARDLIFLVLYLSESLKDKIDIRGLLKDDDIFNKVIEDMEKLENEQEKEPERKTSGAEGKE